MHYSILIRRLAATVTFCFRSTSLALVPQKMLDIEERRSQLVIHNMHVLRRLVRDHARLTALLLSVALMAKALVPAGYMPTAQDGKMVVTLCSASGPGQTIITIPIDRRDTSHDRQQQPDHPCAFTSLLSPTLAATDALLLAVALAFIIAASFRLLPRLVLRHGIYLRPPAIGPPAA